MAEDTFVTAPPPNISVVARGAAVSMAGVAGASALRYAAALIAARALGPGQYGLYTLALSTSVLVGTVALAALDRGLLRYVAVFRSAREHKGERAAVVGTVGLATVLGVAAAVGLYAGADRIAGWFVRGQPPLATLLRIFAVSVPLLSLLTLLTAVTDAWKDMRYRVAIDDLLRNGLFLAVVAAGALHTRLRAADLAAVYVGTLAVAALAALWVCRRYFRLPLVGLTVRTRDVFGFSLPFLLFQVVTRTDQYAGVFLLGLLGTSREVGIFGAATLVATAMGLGIEAVVRIYAPVVASLLARNARQETEVLLRHVTRWSIIWAAPLAAAVFIFSEDLLALLGRGYRAGGLALVILTAGMSVHAGTGPVGAVLNMAGRAWINVANGVAALAVRVLLGLWLIPRYGVAGAAVASALALTGVNLARVAEARAALGIWGFDRTSLRPLAAASGAAALAWLLASWWGPGPGPVRGAAGSVLLLGLYGAGLWLYGLDRSDRAVLSAGVRWLRRRIGAAASLRAG